MTQSPLTLLEERVVVPYLGPQILRPGFVLAVYTVHLELIFLLPKIENTVTKNRNYQYSKQKTNLPKIEITVELILMVNSKTPYYYKS